MNKQSENITFFNAWASVYDWPLFQFWFRLFQKPLLELLHSRKEFSLLDIACGTGQLLSLLSRGHSKATLAGIDASEKMLARARQRVPHVLLKKGDVHHLPFEDASFDYVVSTEAFHHFDDQEKVLREMKRVAKKNGNVVIIDIDFFFSFIHFAFEHMEPGCVRVNNCKEMRTLFQKVGLEIERQKRQNLFSVITVGKNIHS